MTDQAAQLKTIIHDLKYCYNSMYPPFKARRLQEYFELTGEHFEDSEHFKEVQK